MLQTVKLNILIPAEYEKGDYIKTQEADFEVSKAQVRVCQELCTYNLSEWYHYCFGNRPIERNFQNINSPLVNDINYRMSRIELKSVVRSRIGLHHNENVIYSITPVKTDFRIGKVRMIFTKSRIVFLHLEVYATSLTEEETLRFINAFSRITTTQPQIEFRKKTAKDKEETIKLTLKQLVLNIINLQSYIPISISENIITPYFQITMIGSINQDTKWKFFESVRALSKRASVKSIENSHIYEGKEPYISRFAGERVSCIYGDINICGTANYSFLTDTGNGLIKTATENYLTAYAFLVSLQILVKNNRINDPDIEYLLNAPVNLSDEDNIREFYEKCLWTFGWNLSGEIASLKEAVQRSNAKTTAGELEHIGEQLDRHDKKLTATSELIKGIDRKLDVILEFVETDLRKYIEKEKKDLRHKEEKVGKETAVNSFTREVCAHIDNRIKESGDEIVELERKSLELLFGSRWDYLMQTSQTSLISAGVLLKRCSDINIPDFDYSGICICATAALEAELKRVFFDGLLNYMVNKYGNPENLDAEEIYMNWPDALLTVPKARYSGGNYKPNVIKLFTMGTLPSLFGGVGKLSEKSSVREYQLEQSAMMMRRMSEYLDEIVNENYSGNSINAFYVSSGSGRYLTGAKDCFVWKCEKIRNDYRNKAAHVDVMSEQEAANCYQSIVRRPEQSDVLVLKTEITGVILEMFSKINGDKLTEHLKAKSGRNTRRSLPDKNSFSVGQVVELTNLEVTSKGVLRGIIVNSNVGVALSKKHLLEMGLNATSYVGKRIKVKLTRWDINAKKFNAEWVGRS